MLIAWTLMVVTLTLSTCVGAFLVRRWPDLGLTILTTLFAGYVLSANVLVPRLVSVPLLVGSAVIPSGSLLWPFTGQIADMINEVYGKSRAYVAVLMAYMTNLLFVLFVVLVGSMMAVGPALQEQYWHDYFSLAPRILIASGISFLMAELVDITIFSRLKASAVRANEDASTIKLISFAALRGAASDLGNMLIDSILFVVIAFVGALPTSAFWTVLTSSLGVKCLFGVLDTPWFVAFRLMTRNVPRQCVVRAAAIRSS